MVLVCNCAPCMEEAFRSKLLFRRSIGNSEKSSSRLVAQQEYGMSIRRKSCSLCA
jgi:hypothetical protein